SLVGDSGKSAAQQRTIHNLSVPGTFIRSIGGDVPGLLVVSRKRVWKSEYLQHLFSAAVVTRRIAGLVQHEPGGFVSVAPHPVSGAADVSGDDLTERRMPVLSVKPIEDWTPVLRRQARIVRVRPGAD